MKRIIKRIIKPNSQHDLKTEFLLKGIIGKERIVLVDIGGHEGGFTDFFRVNKSLVSAIIFEPLPQEADKLRKKFSASPEVIVMEAAVGNHEGEIKFNEYSSSGTSSILNFNENLNASAHLDRETLIEHKVKCVQLDNVAVVQDYKEIDLIKIDVQGAELMVIQGAENTLKKTKKLMVELSLQPVYRNSPLITDIIQELAKFNFILLELIPAYINETGELIQCDGLFVNKNFMI
jgi:FkbM family methyltransferase